MLGHPPPGLGAVVGAIVACGQPRNVVAVDELGLLLMVAAGFKVAEFKHTLPGIVRKERTNVPTASTSTKIS